MGFWTKLNKFTDKIDPAARWTENKIFGKDDPTFGSHKARYQPGFSYTPVQLPQVVNPHAGILPQYTSQDAQQGAGLLQDSLAPMRMYQNRDALQSQYGTPDALAPMQMYNQFQATGTNPATGGK